MLLFAFAVVAQRYEVQVYDEFVISGNTAVLRCHIPSYVRDYVAVVTWEREDGVTITSNVAVGKLYFAIRLYLFKTKATHTSCIATSTVRGQIIFITER